MIFKKEKSDKTVALPKHIALDLEGVGKWAEEQHVSLDDAYKKSFSIIHELVEQQIKLNIPVLTFFVMSPNLKGTQQADALMEQFATFLENESVRKMAREHKIKVTVLGKWYDLSQRMVEAIRKSADDTKGYDSFFLNFCVNYDGREEIVDASKLIGRQIKMSKVDPDMITKEMLKENLYSSFFIPPGLIIRNGREKILTSLLLWDSVGAHIHFTQKLFPEFTEDEFIRILARR